MQVTHRRRTLSPTQAAKAKRPIDALLNADLFKALGDPTRLKILACLAKCARPCSVGEIAACCSVDLSVVSRHLATLARAGLLESSRKAQTVLYTVRYTDFAFSLRTLADAFEDCRPENCCEPGCCPPAPAKFSRSELHTPKLPTQRRPK